MTTFEGSLSREVVNFLIATYAIKVPGKPISWEYGPLPYRTWGLYRPSRKIVVNERTTKDRFRQQVETILHEIQHANQHARDLLGEDEDRVWASRKNGRYWNRPIEVEARAFATKELDGAMAAIGKLLAGKVEGELDDVLEELLELWDEQGTISRRDVGEALRDYDLNNAKNLKATIEELRALGVEIK